MKANLTTNNYWFTIEPYVFIGITNERVLLYNTLDKSTIESEKIEVIELLHETIKKENNGVTLLSGRSLQIESIKLFIKELRDKFMGDIIDVTLSKGKPVQLLPFFNYLDSDKFKIYKRHNFSLGRNLLKNLSEITFHINSSTNIIELLAFLHSIPAKLTINITGNLNSIPNLNELFSFLNTYSGPKNILLDYTFTDLLPPSHNNNFSYVIVVNFPVNLTLWKNSIQLLLDQSLPFEYVFNVSSLNDCEQSENFINQFQIQSYHIKPIFTGDNLDFFMENVFVSKKDILATHHSVKNIFTNQSLNIFDFGKINILPNGDVFANVNHPKLGNIYMNSLHELVRKELEEGKSWLRIRNQAPCTNCIYQWLCPPLLILN